MSKIELRALDMHWLGPPDRHPYDHCAHGFISFAIDGRKYVNSDDALSVAAAALFLLRTLTRSHSKAQPVTGGNQLFPHCGHFPLAYDHDDEGVAPELQRSPTVEDSDPSSVKHRSQGVREFGDSDRYEVLVEGCTYGPNPEVLHVNGAIRVVAEDGTEATVPFEEWKGAVFAFADQVKAFYDSSPPRIPWDDPQDDGFAAIWTEWKRRRGA